MRDFKDIKVAVAGTGYVGLSIATLLSQHHHVTAVDVIPEKVEKLNNKISPIQDDYIEKYLAEKPLNLVATLDGKSAYADADFVVIAAPTNYDPVKNYFDTTHVEEVIDLGLYCQTPLGSPHYIKWCGEYHFLRMPQQSSIRCDDFFIHLCPSSLALPLPMAHSAYETYRVE